MAEAENFLHTPKLVREVLAAHSPQDLADMRFVAVAQEVAVQSMPPADAVAAFADAAATRARRHNADFEESVARAAARRILNAGGAIVRLVIYSPDGQAYEAAVRFDRELAAKRAERPGVYPFRSSLFPIV